MPGKLEQVGTGWNANSGNDSTLNDQTMMVTINPGCLLYVSDPALSAVGRFMVIAGDCTISNL